MQSCLLFRYISPEDDKDPFCTKVGGIPVWLINKDVILPKCGICGSILELAVQAYCPLDILSTHERVLYIFCCVKSGCSSQSAGWCVLRLQALATEFVSNETESSDDNSNTLDIANNNWQVSGDWDASEGDPTNTPSDSGGLQDLEDLLHFRDTHLTSSLTNLKNKSTQKIIPKNNSNNDSNGNKKKKNNNNNNANNGNDNNAVLAGTNSVSHNPGFFVPYYVVVTQEIFDTPTNTVTYTEGETDSDSEWIGEEYEYTPDRTMSKFLKRLAFNPTQCIRYNFNGAPLLMYSDSTLAQIPPCSCGEPRVFELQLVSTLIYLLNSRNKSCGLDFGIVAIFVCAKSCTNLDVQQEFIYVQPEINK